MCVLTRMRLRLWLYPEYPALAPGVSCVCLRWKKTPPTSGTHSKQAKLLLASYPCKSVSSSTGVTKQGSGQWYWMGRYWQSDCLPSICDLRFRLFVVRPGMFLCNSEGGASCPCHRSRAPAISSQYRCPERLEHCLVTPQVQHVN